MKSRFNHGLVMGLAWLLPTTFWMIDLTPPGWLAAAAIHSSFLALGVAVIPPRKGRQIALIGIITLIEFARWRFPFGGVPLATIPISQAASPIASVVRIAGPLLLVALTTTIACFISTAITSPKKIFKVFSLGIAFAAAIIIVTNIAPTGKETGQIEVAIVQGGGPQRTRATPTGAAIVFENQVVATGNVEAPVDLVIWPENVVNPDPDLPPSMKNPDRLYADDARVKIKNLANKLDAVLASGWFHQDPENETDNLNYVEVVEPNGEVAGRFDKVRIVPFGEFVPFRSFVEKFAKGSLPSRDVRPGNAPAFIDSSIGRLGVVISWEVFFEERAREAAKNNSSIILNPTNGASYWLTQVQSQQVASSRLRAMETGRWVLQSAPTGFSAIIDSSGKVIKRTGISEQSVIQATAELRSGDTWATTIGPWPMLILSFLLFIFGFRSRIFRN